jgi:hypothetical protein
VTVLCLFHSMTLVVLCDPVNPFHHVTAFPIPGNNHSLLPVISNCCFNTAKTNLGHTTSIESVQWIFCQGTDVDHVSLPFISWNMADSWQIPQYSPPVSRSNEMKPICFLLALQELMNGNNSHSHGPVAPSSDRNNTFYF